jgi:hypothetical protein
LHPSELRWTHRTSPRHGRLVSPISAHDALVFAFATAPFFARTPTRVLNHRACGVDGHPTIPSVFATTPSDRASAGLAPVRSAVIAGCNMPSHLPPDTRTTKAGPPRSSGFRHLHRYYGPLGLPLGTAGLHIPLIPAAFAQRGPPRRVSPVPHQAVPTCPLPYPGSVLRLSGLHAQSVAFAPK